MFEIGDLLRILPKLHILKVLDLLLGQDQLIFTLLVGCSKFLLEMFHLLDEQFLVTQPLLKDKVLLLLALEVELQKDLVLLLRWLGVGLGGEGLEVTIIVISA